jgi:hypothetical protein
MEKNMKKIIASFCLSMSLFGYDQALAMRSMLAIENHSTENYLASKLTGGVAGQYVGFYAIGATCMEDAPRRQAVQNIVAGCGSRHQVKAAAFIARGDFTSALRVALMDADITTINACRPEFALLVDYVIDQVIDQFMPAGKRTKELLEEKFLDLVSVYAAL